MASLQLRSGSWRVIFRHNGLQHFVTVGEVEETEAQGVKKPSPRVPAKWARWILEVYRVLFSTAPLPMVLRLPCDPRGITSRLTLITARSRSGTSVGDPWIIASRSRTWIWPYPVCRFRPPVPGCSTFASTTSTATLSRSGKRWAPPRSRRRNNTAPWRKPANWPRCPSRAPSKLRTAVSACDSYCQGKPSRCW
jgi:hypothetical protein